MQQSLQLGSALLACGSDDNNVSEIRRRARGMHCGLAAASWQVLRWRVISVQDSAQGLARSALRPPRRPGRPPGRRASAWSSCTRQTFRCLSYAIFPHSSAQPCDGLLAIPTITALAGASAQINKFLQGCRGFSAVCNCTTFLNHPDKSQELQCLQD